MRVIAGELGGRKLKSIDRPGLRPTTDRVRESIFNMLSARIDFEGIAVLDLFAGTGALGIEAISRGAARAIFVEQDRRSVAVITENLRTLGIERRADVAPTDVLRYLASTDKQFDLILADPPYAAALFDRLVDEIFSRDRLSPDGLFVLEHSSAMRPASPDGAEVIVEMVFGDTGVTVYRKVESRESRVAGR
jgi:16S rRNA (guanine966-N2)-methyltransferase